MRQRWIGTLVVSLLAAGCGDPAGPGSLDLVVTTDKPEYSLRTDSIARVTLANRSDGAVYLPMDSYLVYERLRDGEWQDAFAWFIVDGIGRSFRLEAGATLTDELQVPFYLAGRPGTYRFRYFVYADSRVRFLLPVEQRVSQPVVVRQD